MKFSKTLLMLLLIVCLFIPQLAVAKDKAKVGKVTTFSGTVQMKRGGGEKEFSVFKNMSFTQGDSFTTGKKSELQLLIDSNKQVTAASNTKFVVSELLTSIKDADGKTTLSLINGKVKVKINKKLDGDSRFQVKTPTAIMGVMGTEFYVYYDQFGTWVGVMEGTVQVDLLDGSNMEPLIITPEQSFHMDQQGNWTVGTFDELQEERFYEEEGSTPVEEPAREVIVYDPSDTGGGDYTIPPVSNKPTLVRAEPIYEQSQQFVIEYNGRQQQLDAVYSVNYYNGMNGREAGLTRLQENSDYTIENDRRLVMDTTGFANPPAIANNQQQFLLEFSAGDMLDVVMPYQPAPIVLERELHMKEPMFTNGIIEIPFDQPIAANGTNLTLTGNSIEIRQMGNKIDVTGTVTIGGSNQNVLVIALDNPQLLPVEMSPLELYIEADTLKARNNETVIADNLLLTLPLYRWNYDMPTHQLAINTTSVPAEQSMLLYAYGIGDIDVANFAPVVFLDYGVGDMELPTSDYTLEYIGTGFAAEHAKFRLTLKNAPLQLMREAILNSNSARLNLALDASAPANRLPISVVGTEQWLDMVPDAGQVNVLPIADVKFTTADIWKQMWLANQQVLQPLYMVGNIDTSSFNDENGMAMVGLPDIADSFQLWLQNGLLAKSSGGQQTSPHLWFDLFQSGSSTPPLPTYIYTKQNVPVHLLLSDSAVINQIEYTVDSGAVAELPAAVYTSQPVTGAASPDKIINVTLQKQWLADAIAAASDPNNVEITLTVHYTESGTTNETVSFVVRHKVN
ncbi:FecR domain-containing protein [Paenibacillus yanchengensis]|uniref:FecR domain-containing protein n=1 Tax=Paenibacillus yanchengensis TaxID=2035833 RepID=A0ABW4YIE5_9BACL